MLTPHNRVVHESEKVLLLCWRAEESWRDGKRCSTTFCCPEVVSWKWVLRIMASKIPGFESRSMSIASKIMLFANLNGRFSVDVVFLPSCEKTESCITQERRDDVKYWQNVENMFMVLCYLTPWRLFTSCQLNNWRHDVRCVRFSIRYGEMVSRNLFFLFKPNKAMSKSQWCCTSPKTQRV